MLVQRLPRYTRTLLVAFREWYPRYLGWCTLSGASVGAGDGAGAAGAARGTRTDKT